MDIEWWMLDGLIGLILLIAIIRGIVKGIGDGVFRLLGIVGGLALGVFYSGRVAEVMSETQVRNVLFDHIYKLLLPGAEEAAAQSADTVGNNVARMIGQTPTDPITEAMPKTLGGLVSGLAKNTAEAAADRLTEIAVSILSFVAILIAVWFVMLVIRLIYKSLRDQSFLLGFVDRLLGMVLGLVRGMILSCVAIAALIPVATIFFPDRVPDILMAMKDTYVAHIVYDINPMMLLVRLVLG